MTVVTRFAPSPTGFLHIGGARTALFNWLFARHHQGKFLLRIEDTDRARSTQEAVDAIIQSLEWLGVQWDDEPVFQFSRAKRHAEVAHRLLAEGKAYYCYCTPEELEQMREKARAEGRPPRYDGRWRHKSAAEAPTDRRPSVRLAAPQEGETVIHDMVQGTVTLNNQELDDMVLLRGDGTPTYMLSVVVDDHDMGVTHVIRGDDHLTNAFRQYQIYSAMGWNVPAFSHIPLIHGADGAKLSKRHGAIGTEAYQEMGILPAALRNYLLRLGWSHGDDELISTEQAIAWFSLEGVGKSPARLDLAKLTNVNAHYMRETSDEDLMKELLALKASEGITPQQRDTLKRGMPGLKLRAKTLVELWDSAQFYLRDLPNPFPEEVKGYLGQLSAEQWDALSKALRLTLWNQAALEATVRAFAEEQQLKLGQVAQPLRVALTGSKTSPGLFDVMEVFGAEETLNRMSKVHALLPETV